MFSTRVSKEEVRDALQKMKNGKAVGLDRILVEIWKCLGEEGLEWLTELFNVILGPLRCPANVESVQSSRFTRTRVIFKIVMIIKVLNCLVTL